MDDNEVNDEAVEAYLFEKERAEKERIEKESAGEELARKKEFLKISIAEVFDSEGNELEMFANFFLSYLIEKKGIQNAEHDLNLVTFEELREIIYQFKQKYFAQSLQIFEPSELHEDNADIRSQIEREFKAQKVYYSNGGWDYQLTGYEECQKVDDYFPIKQGERPHVEFKRNFTKKCGGFFGIWGKLELWVEIATNFTKEKVERKIQDFIFLRTMLSLAHPGTFIPPLNVNQKELQRINEQNVKTAIVKECNIFINRIINHEQLLSNIFCFRFFKEVSYDGYVNHKKKHEKLYVNQVRQIGNVKGLVKIQISDANQLIKKDYSRTCEVFEKFWRNIADSNNRITAKLKEVKAEIEAEKNCFDNLILELTHYSQNFHSQSYEKMLKNIFTVFRDNFNSYQGVFDSINSQAAIDSQKNWKEFLNYKTQINEIAHEYQIRRKVFLQKQMKKQEPAVREGNVSPANQSIISEYGLENNSLKQAAWIERFAKWQGYLNCEFINSFERLLNSNVDSLNAVLQSSTEKLLSAGSKEQKSLIENISQIS